MNDVDESSIPHFIEFPVKTPDDWKAMKERYRFDDPSREIPQKEMDDSPQTPPRGDVIRHPPGPYGMMRSWMGFENLSVAFYEYPDMIHDMIEHTTELTVRQIRRLPAELPIDLSNWWEDMASKNGPFVGPRMFREFLQPQYRRIMDDLRKHGCVIGIVDCDGNPHDIVANWLEEGVNVMFPVEVAAGCDPYAWRKEFSKEMCKSRGHCRGAAGRRRQRHRPRTGTHQAAARPGRLYPPPGPPRAAGYFLRDYCQYLEKKRKLIGKK